MIGLTGLMKGTTGVALTPRADGTISTAGATNAVAFLEQETSSLPSIFGIASSAGSTIAGQISPGELISLYGANIGPEEIISADLQGGEAPTELGGTSVTINGSAVPLLYAQKDQINAIVPFGVASSSSVMIRVNNAGNTSNEAQLGATIAAPQAFKDSQLRAAALNQDGTINTDSNRAPVGSIVSLFVTGLGSLMPAPPDGSIIDGALPQLLNSVQVLPYNTEAPLEVLYAGPAPGLMAGVMQINFRLPPSSGTADPEFYLKVDGRASDKFILLVK